MNNVSINKLTYLIYSIILIGILFSASDKFTVDWAHILFLIQLALAIRISKDFETKWAFFLSPSFLLVFYVNFNIFVGAYALKENLLIEFYQHRSTSFKLIQNINIPYLHTAICSLVSMMVLPSFKVPKIIAVNNSKSSFKTVILCFALISIFAIIKIDLSIIGGGGDFSTIPKSITSIILFYELAKRKHKYRFIIYLIVLLLFMATNFESKREAVFMIIPIVLLENIFGNLSTFNFTLRKIIISIFSFLAIVYSLLIMTILRGFGGYDLSNPLNAFKYVDNLVKDFNISKLLFTISEAPTTTYVSIKAMSSVNNNLDLLTYGSTYLKLLFVPIPRSFFGEKPESMTTIFTKMEDPGFYGIGGSLPINIYAESFWNFHFGGVFVILAIVISLNFMFSKVINLVLKDKFSFFMAGIVFAYTYIVGFYRGFGFDLYSVNIIFGFIFSLLISWLINVFLNISPTFKKL